MPENNTPVTDLEIKKAKPADKPYRLGIGENTYCEVMPSGRKVWRMRFIDPNTNKPAIYTIGRYMDKAEDPRHISLKQVRRSVDDAKYLIERGIHPLRERERLLLANKSSSEKEFEHIARMWWSTKQPEWEPKNANKIIHGLERDVFPVIGNAQIDEITAPDVLRMLRKIEKRGALDYMHRTKQRCSLIFSFAVGEGLAERNPVTDIKSNLKKYQGENHRCLKADELLQIMNDLNKWENPVVQLAIKLVMHVYLRTSEIRLAEWSEIDFDLKLWKVPAGRMKMRAEHWIPLSDQAIKLLKQLQEYRVNEYLFVAGKGRKPMSNGTMLQALYDLGYRGKATVHGFRATFSTIAGSKAL